MLTATFPPCSFLLVKTSLLVVFFTASCYLFLCFASCLSLVFVCQFVLFTASSPSGIVFPHNHMLSGRPSRPLSTCPFFLLSTVPLRHIAVVHSVHWHPAHGLPLACFLGIPPRPPPFESPFPLTFASASCCVHLARPAFVGSPVSCPRVFSSFRRHVALSLPRLCVACSARVLAGALRRLFSASPDPAPLRDSCLLSIHRLSLLHSFCAHCPWTLASTPIFPYHTTFSYTAILRWTFALSLRLASTFPSQLIRLSSLFNSTYCSASAFKLPSTPSFPRL